MAVVEVVHALSLLLRKYILGREWDTLSVCPDSAPRRGGLLMGSHFRLQLRLANNMYVTSVHELKLNRTRSLTRLHLSVNHLSIVHHVAMCQFYCPFQFRPRLR